MRLTGFEGATAFVTGAAGGIGQEVVAALRDAGARVMASDIAEALEAAGCRDSENIVWRALDVRSDGTDALLAEAAALWGPVTLGVHAAGILAMAPLTEMSEADWLRVIDINTSGTFRVTSALGRAMRTNGKGAIVVVSSNAAGVPRMNMGAYAASKAAATMMTRCLGLELAQYGIRCNIIAPGSTMTPMQTGMWQDDQGPTRVIEGDLQAYRNGIPLQKIAAPEDIARAVLFMLSNEAGHVTMADLYVDGGATLRA